MRDNMRAIIASRRTGCPACWEALMTYSPIMYAVQYEVPRVGKLDPIEMIRAYLAAYFGGPGSCAVPYDCRLFRWPGKPGSSI